MKWYDQDTKKLFAAILKVQTQDEMKRFFRDLMTEEEIKEFSRRWKVARLLSQGKTYKIIEKQTGMSSTTIARIAKWLNDGMGGYKKAVHHHTTPSKGGVH